jgi:hypothetical protein
MARTPTEEERVQAAAHAVALLNQLQATLTGWVLQFDADEVDKCLVPLYEKLDQV